jgi:glucan-binding YG repeat protein
MINGKWYFFGDDGYMRTGWILWNGVYYYCGPDGAMFTNCYTPDGYYVDGNGAWVH